MKRLRPDPVPSRPCACGSRSFHRLKSVPSWACDACHPPRTGDVVVELHRVEEGSAS